MMREDHPDVRPYGLGSEAPDRGSTVGAGRLRSIVSQQEQAGNPSPHQRPLQSDDLRPDPFQSILFPPGSELERAERNERPPCFVDLNLDQVVDAIVSKRDQEVLRPFFYSTYRNAEIVRYRQAIFADLERPDVFPCFPDFCESMRAVRANLAYAGKISYKCHRNMVGLRAIILYCSAVEALSQSLEAVDLRSVGLKKLRDYLTRYLKSDAFSGLAVEARRLREILSKVSYGTLFRGDRVTVRKYAAEPDYAVTILERFARFREALIEPPAPSRSTDDFSLNHIEEGILEFVGRLFPREFHLLEAHLARNSAFIDEVIASFDKEVEFFVAYLSFIEPLRRAGLPFCRPDVSETDKQTKVVGSFDLALATKLFHEGSPIVRNDFFLRGSERLIVVSGPNQGGKTTFARMFGQLHFLAGLGCPIPGGSARLFLPDQIFTHFEREEDITNLRGKLEEELVSLHSTCQAMTANSVVVLNEIFNSTSFGDQVFLSTKVLERILATDAIGVCVTFIDALSTLGEKTVSMVSTVTPDDPGRRTFEVVRKPADGLAYALSLAEKRGVTYELLRTRVRL